MTTREEALAALKRMTSQPKGYSIQQYALDHRTVIDALNLIPETVEEPRWRCAQCRERYSDPKTHRCAVEAVEKNKFRSDFTSDFGGGED